MHAAGAKRASTDKAMTRGREEGTRNSFRKPGPRLSGGLSIGCIRPVACFGDKSTLAYPPLNYDAPWPPLKSCSPVSPARVRLFVIMNDGPGRRLAGLPRDGGSLFLREGAAAGTAPGFFWRGRARRWILVLSVNYIVHA